MASSIIEYKKKYIDVNDNILLLTLFYIKESSKELNEKPEWFLTYINEVIDSVILSKPIGWGYMDLDEYINNNEKFIFFKSILNNCKLHILNNNEKYINNQTVTSILNDSLWIGEKHLILTNLLIEFLDDLILLLDPKASKNNERFMKIND